MKIIFLQKIKMFYLKIIFYFTQFMLIFKMLFVLILYNSSKSLCIYLIYRYVLTAKNNFLFKNLDKPYTQSIIRCDLTRRAVLIFLSIDILSISIFVCAYKNSIFTITLSSRALQRNLMMMAIEINLKVKKTYKLN